MLYYTIIFIILFIIEIAYLKIARFKNIKDSPNHRSSHTTPTVRGGGIVVFFAIIIYSIFYKVDTNFLSFLIPISLVAIVSFVDDLVTLPAKTRIFIQIFAFTVLFFGLDILKIDSLTAIFFLVSAYFFSIGFLNIYNFMDGINGITFLNALVTYSTLLFLSENYFQFIDSNLLVILIIAVSIFGFFNFRKKPLCFAGDIGSITIGFSIVYFVLKLFILTGNPLIMVFLFVYIIDGGWTIVERIFKRENVFQAHKSHLYQILVNELNINHLIVSSGYFMVQLLINLLMIYLIILGIKSYLLTLLILVVLSILYFVLKRQISRRKSPN